MHLLAAKPGGFVEDGAITYVQQSPGDIVILSAQDTDLTLLADAAGRLPDDFPSVRLASLLHLRQHAAVDIYADEVLQNARFILISLLGGTGYWPYGVDRVTAIARERSIPLALLPGDDHPDEELAARSTVLTPVLHRLWRYLREGGPHNADQFFRCVGTSFFGRKGTCDEPRPLPRVLVYRPGESTATLEAWRKAWSAERPVAALLFYRAHLQAGNTKAFDALIGHLDGAGMNPLPIAVTSLKDPVCLEITNTLCHEAGAGIILNTTGFALGVDAELPARVFDRDVPVLQLILSGGNQADWRTDSRGLRAADLAMNVALPEVDGRIITRAVSFKGLLRRDARTESDLVTYELVADRAAFVAQLARNWIRLSETPNADKRIALVLANYPTREGRIGNGVGLDTPASVISVLQAMQAAGYPVEAIPEDGTALIEALLGAITNDLDTLDARVCHQSLTLSDYRRFFTSLPIENQTAVTKRWGPPEADPRVRNGRIMIPGVRFGMTFVGIQPTRGYDLDPAASYHDPDLIPPHAYLAFYHWVGSVYGAHAVVHVGKHGNLEWLPGKGTALSQRCWPETSFGPLPHLYPFIVNDPGEGAQAKRRAQAVIIDHLVPPLTRAETYGGLRELETLVDEYYDALDLDPRRTEYLRRAIVDSALALNLHRELDLAGMDRNRDAEQLMARLDTYLCELKESQIRDGLHILGQTPAGAQRADTLAALLRLPRGGNAPEARGLLHALAADLGFDADFDPLDCDLAALWSGPRAPVLAEMTDTPWRTAGDTRERLELFAKGLLAGGARPSIDLPATDTVLEFARDHLGPALDACGRDEIANLLAGLDGRFVAPGPSGAPSRGRLDVLPTGRNFYSVDVRAIPSPTAWQLGWRSAAALVERYLQEHGDYPRTLGLSVWGTATMRTGGDDIAQAMALLGVRPRWTPGTNRVVDFEVLPAALLDRPRVDVTLRISGFFRDAFMNVVQLFDAAVQAVAELDEDAETNPIRARIAAESERLREAGLSEVEARRSAGWRVFGSKPGAYGAGLQGLMDGRQWENVDDLASAYVNWSGYAYGTTDTGTTAHGHFRERLASLQVVLQNQDNREHDILDSDDYYQFHGGMAAGVRSLSARTPTLYHADHANPAAPRVRSLREEVARVVRARVVNPKWIAGARRHGYKGAFEMAATVDYLFAFDATTEVVEDFQYEMVADGYLFDPDNRAFLEQHNPNAMKEMTERLIEAIQRGLWAQPGERGEKLEALLLATEHGLEQGSA